MAEEPRRRDLRNEAHHLPSTLEDLIELRRRVIEAGYGAPLANSLIGWLLSKAADEPDVSSSATRAKYRKILAELEYLAPDPDPGRIAARADEVVDVDAERRRRRPPEDGKRSLGPAARKTFGILALALAAAGVGAGRAERADAATVTPMRAPTEIRAESGQLDRTARRRRRAA